VGAERRNLELKAKDPHPERSLGVCEELGADDRGTLLQQDTYFAVPRGRLKLRRQQGSAAQLIAYERSDAAERRESRYRIVEVDEASELEAALAGALGVIAVVRKSRRLFLFEGVRIHLDSVEGLGNFIEFEGVAEPGEEDLQRFELILSDLKRSFGIEDADLIGESYSDLVAKNLHSARNT
jgi:predicted adenylyl cyclase CyaB